MFLVHTPGVVTFYVFLLIVGALGAVAYLLMFMSHVPGAANERFGTLDALPSSLNKWVEDEALSSDGLVCERRHLMAEQDASKMILQVRYRDPKSHEIVRVEAEQTIKRRRRRA